VNINKGYFVDREQLTVVISRVIREKIYFVFNFAYLLNKTIHYKNMKTNTAKDSELKPPYNITPSTKTTLTGILILLPLTLFFLSLFTGLIKP
jgi:hypothetical protein